VASRTLEVNAIARVEGEGALLIRYRGKEPTDVQLRIYEPPRLFEAFLRTRGQLEAPDLTSRICGICPVAYMMSACHAIEDAHGVVLDQELRALRTLLYCGEWIESHVLHMVMLHAPDFLGLENGIEIAKKEPARVRAALRMKKAGNTIMQLIGGREIHPINVRVGGFYKAPTRAKLETILPELEWGVGAARELLEWCASFSFPECERDWELVALRHMCEYPMNGGRIVSSEGLDIDVHEYEAVFVEEQVAHSTALHSTIRGRGGYLTGPLARFALNFDRLSPVAREAAQAIGLRAPCRNPYQSILVRGVEVIHAFDEARRIVTHYVEPKCPFVEIPERAAVGVAATEAPRGMLWHRYAVDGEGLITEAKIVPPTSQNQRSIEADLRAIAPELITLPKARAARRAEHAIRNHDPCISCSTHFLEFKLEEE
jgi:coenzyme F420-reducing hydrogenase alpha subunit